MKSFWNFIVLLESSRSGWGEFNADSLKTPRGFHPYFNFVAVASAWNRCLLVGSSTLPTVVGLPKESGVFALIVTLRNTGVDASAWIPFSMGAASLIFACNCTQGSPSLSWMVVARLTPMLLYDLA
jgi:hypothetical protein